MLKILIIIITLQFITLESYSISLPFFSKKKIDSTKIKPKPTIKPKFKEFKEIINSKAIQDSGLFIVYKIDKNYYFNIPFNMLNRDYLVVNKFSKVSSRINEIGINKGINYENQVISFDLNIDSTKLYILNRLPYVEVKEDQNVAQSVKDNYISSLMDYLTVECLNADSSGIIVKINKILDGTNTTINNVFSFLYIIGGAINKDLSEIKQIKSFPENIVAKSDFSTKVSENGLDYFVSVSSTVNIVLLPKEPMKAIYEDNKVGYFTVKRYYFEDNQIRVDKKQIVTRWRLEPKQEDIKKYIRGELVEPQKPIVYYIDKSTPKKLVPYIEKGILDWQKAFEKAGFKNAIQVKEIPENDTDFDPDDVRYSVLTYVAAPIANAMGPSVYDPRSGEIIEADIIWWHNILSVVNSWLKIQTSQYNSKVKQKEIPLEIMGNAVCFITSHEVGHTLGLRHNMMGSYNYPNDSLHSKSFTSRNGTSSSIMDYARFNYLAQANDSINIYYPQIGQYDEFAIHWAYKYYDTTEIAHNTIIKKYVESQKNNKYCRYGNIQDIRSAIDPRSQLEDLGDNPIESSSIGISNLKKVIKEFINWELDKGDDYKEAGKMFSDIILNWNYYIYHVMTNIGGLYIDNASFSDNFNSISFVEREKQEKSLDFLIKEAFTFPSWLLDNEIIDNVIPMVETPEGYMIAYSPMLIYKHNLSFFIWDLMDSERFGRMIYNESKNKSKAFTVIEMFSRIHNHIFANTIKNNNLSVSDRLIQRCFVDALVISIAKNYEVKDNKAIQQQLNSYNEYSYNPIDLNLSPENKPYFKNNSMQPYFIFEGLKRMSENISIKRGELVKIRELVEKRLNTSDEATKYHYYDLIRRIEHINGNKINE